MYRYSINMKYKQAEEGREGIRSVWWFGFAFPFGHQGDRTPTRQPAPERNETKRASAEEIHPSPLSRPLSAPLPTAPLGSSTVRLLLFLEYRVARSAKRADLIVARCFGSR